MNRVIQALCGQALSSIFDKIMIGQKQALIAIGGFPGSGKSVLAKYLSTEFSIPRLGSDTFGRGIKNSGGVMNGEIDAYWIAYDLIFDLCEEFLQSGLSVILDLNMGRAFHWDFLDEIIQKHPHVIFLPFILRCPRQLCMERVQRRHEKKPDYYEPPGQFTSEENLSSIEDFLNKLNRRDIHFIDATKKQLAVQEEVMRCISNRLDNRTTN